MNLREAAQQATPREQLLKELMDSRVPKTEREHAAAREIERLRAALAEPTIKDNLTVEPVAYITGYSKGRYIIKAVDPDWLLPVGMALYRSPPTISKTETVEPVAWMRADRGHVDFHRHPDYLPLYTAPPKSKPLTDDEIAVTAAACNSLESEFLADFARAIERAHGIGDEK